MRFYKVEDMDDREADEPPVQDTELRRLVDLLPPVQRHILNRCFFGGAYLTVAARELGIDKRVARTLRDEALAQLKVWLVDPPEEDPALEAEPDVDALVWRCGVWTKAWGACQQPAQLEGRLCAFHREVADRSLTPDPAYERAVVLGLKTPVQSFLSKAEMDALVTGRYRGDGRRLDTYTLFDNLDGVYDA